MVHFLCCCCFFFFWLIIFTCLVHSSYLTYLRIVSCVHTHFLAKMDPTAKACEHLCITPHVCMVEEVSWLQEWEICGLGRAQSPPLIVLLFSSWSFRLSWWLRWYRICLQCWWPRLIHGSRRSTGEGKGNPLQYSHLENPINRNLVGLQSMGRVRHDWVSN